MFRSDVLAQQLYTNYKSKLIQITRGFYQASEPDISALENNDKHLICKKDAKENIKLGDRVKIKLKKRQLKQQQQDEWDELMIKDIDKIGTVIVILPDGSNEPIVHFPNSGHRWLVQPSALCNVSDKIKSDGSDKVEFLKVGDYVEIGYGDGFIKQLQRSKSHHWELVVLFKDLLGKILSYEANGYAYVSVGATMSLLINPVILKRRSSNSSRKADLERPFKIPTTEMQKKYPIHSDVQIKTDIKEFVKQPFWKYQLTQILGVKGKVTYHGMLGEVGITIKEQTWILPYMMLEKKKRTRHNSPSPYVNQDFPFTVNDLVVFKFPFIPSFVRTLDELRLPRVFAEACQGFAKFIGYLSPTKCVVEMDGNRLRVKIAELSSPPTPLIQKEDQYKQKEMRHEKLKIGDDVQFNIGLKSLAKHVLHELNIPGILQKIILSPAKLIAFDDNNDLALLKWRENERYLVDPGFITCLDDTTDVNNFLKSTENLPVSIDTIEYKTSDNDNKISPVANITEAMDFVEQVKNILQTLKIEFHKPDLYFGPILLASFKINVQSGDEIVTELCNKIDSTVDSKVLKYDSQLSFGNQQNSAAIRIKFAEVESMDNDPIESVQANDDIASVQQEDIIAMPFIDDALLEPSEETDKETGYLRVPDSDQHENMDQILPIDSALQQNETSTESNGSNLDHQETGNKEILQKLLRQSSTGEEKFRQNNTFNFFSCNFEHSNLGGSS